MTPTLQRAHDLRLNLIEGPIGDWSQFTIIEALGKTLGPWDIKAHVIGASHLISVTYNHLCFHEIFACMELKSDATRIYYGPIADIGNLSHCFTDQLEYRFDSKILTWRDGEPVMSAIEDKVYNGGEENFGVQADFTPICTTIIPKTIVFVEIDGNALKFETIHSYPNEDCIVFTETMIKEML